MTIQEAMATGKPITRDRDGWTWRIVTSDTGSRDRFWQRTYYGWVSWQDSGGPLPDDILATDWEVAP